MKDPRSNHRNNNFGVHDGHVLNDGHIGIAGYSRNPDIGFFASDVRPEKCVIDRGVQRSLGALNFTQTARCSPITDTAIDTAIGFHLNYTHGKHINYVGFPTGPLKSIWVTVDPSDDDFKARNKDLLLNYEVQKKLLLDQTDFFDAIRKHAYTIWPINIGGHWCVILLHANTQKPKDVSRKDWLCQIEHIVIVDPERDQWLEDFIWDRLVDILTDAGGFTVPQSPQPLWSPTQAEGWSCGLHIYEIMRVIIERINELTLLQNSPLDVYDDSVWASLSGDFQPDKIRAQMIGICAFEAMRMQSRASGARLGLVAVDEIRDSFANKVVKPLALTDLRKLNPFQTPNVPASVRGIKRQRSRTQSRGRSAKRQSKGMGQVAAKKARLIRRSQPSQEPKPSSSTTSPGPNVTTRRASRAMDLLSRWG